VTKLAPPLVQLGLLLLVARESTLEDVGRLALASAVSFLCGALAELGFATTLSIPRPTFGTQAPPLRATGRLRVVSAFAGSLLYVVLWAAGLGGHGAVFLVVAPLPFALALSYGYAGAMNASGRLRIEGAVSVVESVAIVAIAVAGSFFGSALTWSLVALTVGRAGGTAARAILVRGLPQSTGSVAPLFRAQLPFALATLAIVFQGQADMLAIGFFGTLGLAGLYGPLLRTTYSPLLAAEAFSWGLYGDAHPEEHAPGGLFARRWRAATIGLGVVLAIGFAVLAEPFLRFLLHRSIPDLMPAISLFAVVIVLRFAALVLNVEILRAGRQRDEIPVLAVSSLVLAGGAVAAAHASSITGLAGARLASEAIIAAGYLALAGRGPARGRRRERAAPAPGGTTGRLRLLVLTPFPPSLDGAHGGSRVISQFLVRMAERHDVALVCLRHPRDPEVDPVLRGRLALLEEVGRPDWSASKFRRFAGGFRTRLRLFAGTPLWACEVDVGAYRERLRAVLAEWRPDVVQIEYTVMGTYVRELEAAGVPIVLVEPDPASHAALDLQRASRRNRLLRRLDVLAWKQFEPDVLHRVDAAVVYTERDERLLSGRTPPGVLSRIPFGTDFVERFSSSDGTVGGADVLFFGSFVHFPNVDAARRLKDAIFPLVHARHPGSSLYIVGENPPSELAAAADGQVVVTGHVPDLEPYIASAAVVAVPIRLGSGMRVKVLEALAAGKPVVASRLAIEGLGVVDGEQLLTAETDDEFAERISRVLADDALRARLGAHARAWAEQNLSWAATLDRFDELYKRLLKL
jgi:glycosyltransferase involved in cell wall biosynthesis/O-antigen/teichoic acid export membrane protein